MVNWPKNLAIAEVSSMPTCSPLRELKLNQNNAGQTNEIKIILTPK